MKNRKFNIIVFIFILILSGQMIFFEKIGDLDELWQYSFANNILNGLIPYKDFNMICTPLFSFMAAIFLRVFSNQLIVMRIFNTLIFTFILYFTYKIFRQLKVDKIKSVLFLLITYLLFYYDLGVEYNYLVLLIALISLYLELYNTNKNEIFSNKNNFILGMIVGTSILAKHTTGIILSFTFIFYKIIFISNKQEIIKLIKIMIQRAIGVIIPIVIFSIYLLINNSVYDFISYCILGVIEFKNKVSYFDLFFYKNILIRFFAFIVPIVLTGLIYIISNRKNSNFNNLIIIFIYAIAMFIGIFPIANSGHFIIYSFIGIIASIYIIYKIGSKIIKNKKIKVFINYFIKYTITYFIIAYISINTVYLIKLYKNNNICSNELQHYNGILVDRKMIESINLIDNYITQNKEKDIITYILDSSAVIYMLPINVYNKDYDMFNKGNFGKNGEQRLIKEISESKNSEYLILNDMYKKNWQTPTNILNYVKDNKQKIGEIGMFYIYK